MPPPSFRLAEIQGFNANRKFLNFPFAEIRWVGGRAEALRLPAISFRERAHLLGDC